jgi:predicted CXXCH cytochrome family protein
MKPYKIPTNQYDEFVSSVHGKALLVKKDLGAPACNSCHGNHGATPPGVSSVSKVCGTCHALNADLFSASPHKKAFDDRKLPECETCHGNHAIIAATDQLIGVAREAVCSRCHSSAENPKGFLVAQMMRAKIDSLEAAISMASALVNDAEQKGMEIGEAKYALRDVRQARFQSRTMIHSFDETKFREVVEPGLSKAARVSEEARAAIEEYYFRRRGLGVATLIITVLALSLFLYIRRLEAQQGRDNQQSIHS